MASRSDLRASAQPYVAQFQGFSENGARAAPAWLKERRARAIRRFAEVGFPTTREEAWRFTDVKPIASAAFELAPVPSSEIPIEQVRALVPGEASQPTAVFVNGHYVEELSSAQATEPVEPPAPLSVGAAE